VDQSFRILSIDGGGIRGLIPALLLAELEKQAGRPIAELFDLIVGTSTGGIIALGLTMPGPEGRPAHSAQDLAELYLQQRSRIFHRGLWDEIRNPGGLLDERYASPGIEAVLREHFLAARLSEALTEVMVTAYDLEKRDPFFFRSRRAKEDARYDYPMWQAARATSAAPTYFEPLLVPWPNLDRDVLVDGGVFANNPAMCAYAEAQAAIREGRLPASEVLLVSLGTGHFARPIAFDDAKDWGLTSWARPILDVMFDGVADTVDFQLRQILPPHPDGSPRYHRFQVDLDQDLDDMDNITPTNMEGLQRMVRRLLAAQGKELSVLAQRLRRLAELESVGIPPKPPRKSS
jgi:patatin-like phospholipase/acyl hydrolase